jgi:endonuclease/exonuclease/phosphatase (EEP) superfamily protein YafD
MKVISLNTWGGRVSQINDFIQHHAVDTDVFCFQEIYANKTREADSAAGERPEFFEEIQALLPNFTGIFAEQVPGTGLAVFVRNTFEIEKADSHLMFFADELSHLQMANGARYYPRIVQTISLKSPQVTIFNFHGVPGNEKKDSPERNIQMLRLHNILAQHPGEKILVGDFNLRPDTNAIHGLEEGMNNLVIEGGFKTTRTKLYSKKEIMPFADYTFVTPGIKVKKFLVLSDEVSDHSPMLLDFE